MSTKRVVSVVLLAFVAASVGALLSGRADRAPNGASAEPSKDAASEVVAADVEDARVVAYYFHGAARCATCLSIERTAREVLERDLAASFANGDIAWKTLDYERPENEHFAREFELTGATLVLVRNGEDRVERWDRLERVWEFIGDDAAFRDYVLGQARDYLGES